MRTTKELPRSEWRTYFDQFTTRHLKNRETDAATVEVISTTLGDQFETSAVPLLGLTFDPKSEALEVLLEGIDHLIFHPTEIWVMEGEPGFVATLEIMRADGGKEIIYIRRSGPATTTYEFPRGLGV